MKPLAPVSRTVLPVCMTIASPARRLNLEKGQVPQVLAPCVHRNCTSACATIDPSVGIRIHRKVGDPVEEDEPLLTLSYRHPARLDEALSVLEGAITIESEAPEVPPLLIERVGS